MLQERGGQYIDQTYNSQKTSYIAESVINYGISNTECVGDTIVYHWASIMSAFQASYGASDINILEKNIKYRIKTLGCLGMT